MTWALVIYLAMWPVHTGAAVVVPMADKSTCEIARLAVGQDGAKTVQDAFCIRTSYDKDGR